MTTSICRYCKAPIYIGKIDLWYHDHNQHRRCGGYNSDPIRAIPISFKDYYNVITK